MNKDNLTTPINVNSNIGYTIEPTNINENANNTIEKQIVFVDFENIAAPQNKTIQEAKGIITADYQNFLEKQWIASLRSKYQFTVDKDVLSTIK